MDEFKTVQGIQASRQLKLIRQRLFSFEKADVPSYLSAQE